MVKKEKTSTKNTEKSVLKENKNKENLTSKVNLKDKNNNNKIENGTESKSN